MFRLQNFSRQPSEDEWERLSLYSLRICGLMNIGGVFPSGEALKLLTTRFSNGCMIPRLREIRWDEVHPEHLELILPLVVSPVLTNFRLGISSAHGNADPLKFVSAIKALTPAYNSLVDIQFFNTPEHDPLPFDAASTLLFKCNPDKLQHFHMHSPLFEEAFLHVAQLPNLKAFSVVFDATELRTPLPMAMFPLLESLDIVTINTRSPLLQTLTRIQSRTFSRLDLEFPAADVTTFLPKTVEALQSRKLQQTLSVLSVRPDDNFDLNTDFVRPLLFLRQLTILLIGGACHPQCTYNLGDEDLENIAVAMPKLKILSLGDFPCSHPANTTTKGLASIAKHCKNLNELAIHTNVDTVIGEILRSDYWGFDQMMEIPSPLFVDCPVRTITFGPCPIPGERGATIFARTLIRLFPHLDTSHAFPEPGGETNPLWDMVSRLVLVYRA